MVICSGDNNLLVKPEEKVKSISLPVPVSISLWIDLLGYGESLKEIGFNPSLVEAKPVISRLRRFHKIIANSSSTRFRTFTINDGAVAYADLDLIDKRKTEDFINKSFELFDAVNEAERLNGDCGARAVVAVGFRARGRGKNKDYAKSFVENQLKQIAMGKLTAKKALYNAIFRQQPFDVVPELQANFAFTKAYVAEQSGGPGGLPGANLYVEAVVFKCLDHATSICGDSIMWENKKLGIKTNFFRLNALLSENIGCCTGLEIAEKIDPDPKTIDRIKVIRSWKFT